jgi:2-polyprenyl-3-methyl-5-hydroxy-6-metoxy-1,4-benzoquinol methylase
LIKIKKHQYNGWELPYFDNAKNFRNYQFKLIKNHISGVVAEIGPGNGQNLKAYHVLAKKVFLYEPTKKSCLKLQKKFKSKKIFIKNNYFETNKKKYDTIMYLDVLEHIKNDKSELIKAYKALKINGCLIINVPAFWHLFSNFDKDVGHLRRYSKRNIIEITKKLKFKSIQMTYYDSLGYLFSLSSKIFIKDYKKNFKSKIKFWNSLIPLSKFIDIITLNLFGKSLLIIIKK